MIVRTHTSVADKKLEISPYQLHSVFGLFSSCKPELRPSLFNYTLFDLSTVCIYFFFLIEQFCKRHHVVRNITFLLTLLTVFFSPVICYARHWHEKKNCFTYAFHKNNTFYYDSCAWLILKEKFYEYRVITHRVC